MQQVKRGDVYYKLYDEKLELCFEASVYSNKPGEWEELNELLKNAECFLRYGQTRYYRKVDQGILRLG